MNITDDFIISVSVNEAAVKNGADLVKKKQFTQLVTDKDQRFISGECMGSGKKPYICSADFIDENAPVYRCTCPSRQIPCKHVIGLLWAYKEKLSFKTMEIPEDILAKRENKEKRVEKAKEKLENAEKNPPKEKSAAWKRSALKKIDAQLTGIAEAEKMLQSIVQSGLSAMDAKNVNTYAQLVRQLDSYFITGIQNEINDLLGMAHADTEAGYMRIAEKICQIHALLQKSKTYLESKKDAPDKMDTESEIEELIGYAWKLEDLAQHGLVETDALLVELCFHVREEYDKRQFVEEGFFISLNTGKIYKTRNYRPFRAAHYIKEEDSIFSTLHIPKLYRYPSLSLNPRVRWEDFTLNTFEKISPDVYRIMLSFAYPDFSEVVKIVKNQLKNIWLFPHPVMLVRFAQILKMTTPEPEGGDERFILEDASGHTLCLKQSDYCQGNFMFLLNSLTQKEAENNAMLLLFDNDVEAGMLYAQPLALVTEEKIIRLLY